MTDDKKISELTDGSGLRSTDGLPVLRDGGNARVTVSESASLTSVLTSDSVMVLRGTTFYLATVAAVLAATSGTPSTGGTLDFSSPDNSAFAAII